MKNILVIVESFMHRPSPNGICTKKVIDELKKRDAEVTVLTTITENGQPSEEEIEGVKVYAFKRSLGESILLKAGTKSGMIKKMYEAFAKFVLRAWLVLSCFKWPQRSLFLSGKYVSKARKLHKNKPFDAVVAVYMGIDELAAGRKIKKLFPEIQSFIYTLDDLSGRKYPKLFGTDVCLRSIKKWEHKVFSYADMICIMNSHVEHYKDKNYDRYRQKFKVMDIPLFEIAQSQSSTAYPVAEKKGEKIKIIYTGAALVETGNPTYFVDHILPSLLNCELHLYGRIDPTVKKHLEDHELFGKRIFIHGMIPAADVKHIQDEGDCLITFGSDNPSMIPCKIFEYFSRQKPVINVYYSDNDSAYPYVEKYGYSVQILSTDTAEENVQKIEDFIKRIHEMSVPGGDELTRIFWDNTPIPMAETLMQVNN